MRTWGTIDLANVTDPVARENFHKIHIYLRQLSAFVAPELSIPTVEEQDQFRRADKAVPIAGVEGVPGQARIVGVNSDRRLLVDAIFSATPTVDIDELPPTTLASGMNNTQSFPAFVSYIGAIGYGKREDAGGNPAYMGRHCYGQFSDTSGQGNQGWTSPDAVADSDTGLLVMPSPKVHARQPSEFEKNWTTTATQLMTSGTHNGGERLWVGRFKRALISFVTAATGTPTGNFTLRVFGYPKPNETGAILLREWTFDPTEWVADQNSKALEFDITMPFITITAAAAGVDGSNYYTTTRFYVDQISL